MPVATSVKDTIRRRKSVRTFNGEDLHHEDRLKLEEYLKTLENPFGVPVEFRFLDAKEQNLSSPVVVGTDLYIAAKVSRGQQAEIAFGYSFEAFCLFAESLGIGTVMLAATIRRGGPVVCGGAGSTGALPWRIPDWKRTIRRSIS